MGAPHPDRRKTPILLATGNRAKQETLRRLLEGLALCPVAPDQLGLAAVPEEEGDTHQSVARHKAREWSLAASMLAIASDGGLEVPALADRWDSRYTHRFAGLATDDEGRVRRLLELMRPWVGADREASWREGLAIADRGRVLVSWELRGGVGVIAESPGESYLTPGFWAFSLWYFPQFGRFYNQLTPQQLGLLDDHWTRLRQLVRRFFQAHYVPPDQ